MNNGHRKSIQYITAFFSILKYNQPMFRSKKITVLTLCFAVIVAIILAGAFIYQIPFVHEKLEWRIDELRAKIKYTISPPEQIVFTPNPTVIAMVNATLSSYTPSPTPITPTPTPGPTATPTFIPTPTISPTPLPEEIRLTGVVHEYQKYNNCGPANLAMALSYWGWEGDQRDTAAYLKPIQDDKNVMPYEMANYVEDMTDFDIVVRAGGDLETIKRFLAAGFPVLVEKGLDVPDAGWMGHYQVITGYDDIKQRVTAQDSYQGGANLPVPYEKLMEYWRAFNYTYLIIYPPSRESEVMILLGPDADVTYNYQHAAQLASDEIIILTGRDLYFAWFNRGTNLMRLQDYAGAAAAYDNAFEIYADTSILDPDDRPWRMLWYQTGPYFAYQYSGRHYEVISLASQTLSAMVDPILEESFYWRAMAKESLGDIDGAISDLRASLECHPGFKPSLQALDQLGVAP